MRSTRSGLVRLAAGAVALIVLALGAATLASAQPTRGTQVTAEIPRTAFARSPTVVTGVVSGDRKGASVALQLRRGSAWRSVTKSRSLNPRSGGFSLRWKVPSSRGSIVARIVVLRRKRLLATGRPSPILIRARPVILQPADVASVPAPGQRGVIRLKGTLSRNARSSGGRASAADCTPLVQGDADSFIRNNYVAVGYSRATPNGYLGKILDIVGCQGLAVRPASLDEALGDGKLNTAGFAQVSGTSSATQKNKLFERQLSKGLVCSAGTEASVTGNLKIAVAPSLQASFKLFKLRSAQFKLTGAADAELSVKASAGADCSLKDVALIPTVPIAKFAGTVGPFPIVVDLQADVSLNGTVGVSGQAVAGIQAHAEVTAGVSYDRGRFEPVLGSRADLKPSVPTTIGTSAKASVHVVPKLEALLYGVAGPQLTVTTGLDLMADPAANPWWSLTAPFSLDASLAAKVLGLQSDPIHIFPIPDRAYPIATAGGPLGGATTGSGDGPPGPTPVAPQTDLISAGGFTSCAIRTQTLACWGLNGHSQLGLRADLSPEICTFGECSTQPLDVTLPEKPAAVGVGYTHACALYPSRTVDCWGRTEFGQLGGGSFKGPDESCSAACDPGPVSVTGVEDAVDLGVGFDHSCAVVSSGQVKCWGYGTAGQLGNDGTSNSAVPVTVSGIDNAVSVSGGGAHTCAVLSTHHVKCWGWNYAGQLGDGSTTGPQDCGGQPCARTPVEVQGITTAVTVRARGHDFSCALLADGSVSCWGNGARGQLGDGTTSGGSSVPVKVSGLTRAVALAVGNDHACAVEASGTLKCWGSNAAGQLGTGDNTGPSDCSSVGCSRAAVPVPGLVDVRGVSAGAAHTCATFASGAVSCWGENRAGELGDGTQMSRESPVTVSGLP